MSKYLDRVNKAVTEEITGKPAFEGVVYYAPKTAKAAGLLVAGTMTMTSTIGYINVIVTDDLFNKLSCPTQEFFLNHERGHIKAGDSMKIHSGLLYYLSCVCGCPKIERNADIYAAKISGKDAGKKAMKELASLKALPFSAKMQIMRRYIALCFAKLEEN